MFSLGPIIARERDGLGCMGGSHSGYLLVTNKSSDVIFLHTGHIK